MTREPLERHAQVDLVLAHAPRQRRVHLAVGQVRSKPPVEQPHILVAGRILAENAADLGLARQLDELHSLFERHRLRIEVTERLVGLPIADVVAPAAVPQRDLDAILFAVADHPQLLAAAGLLLGERGDSTFEVHVDRERPSRQRRRLRIRLHVVAVAANVRRDHQVAVGVLAKLARQRQLGDRPVARQRIRRHALAHRHHLRLLVVLAGAQLQVRSETASLEEDIGAVFGLGDRHLRPPALFDELERRLDRQLVGCLVFGDARGRLTEAKERAVAADANHHVDVVVAADAHAASVGWIDAVADLVEQTRQPLHVAVELREAVGVKSLQIGRIPRASGRDLVQPRLHRGREVVVHEVRHVLFEHAHHDHAHEGRNQGVRAPETVPAVEQVLNDRGVGAGSSDALVFERPDQRRVVEARRRTGVVTARHQRFFTIALEHFAFGQERQLRRARIAAGLHAEEAVEHNGAATGAERRVVDADLDHRLLELRVLHLARDRAAPDHLVKAGLVRAQAVLGVLGRGEPIAGRSDRLVGLLGILVAGRIEARLLGHVVGTASLFDPGPRGTERLLRQRRRIGTHVGDETLLVQRLGDPHRARGGEPKAPVGVLLQGRRRVRRVRLLRDRLDLAGLDHHRLVGEPGNERPGGVTIEHHRLGVGELAGRLVKIAPVGDAHVIDAHQGRIKRVFGAFLAQLR